MSESLNEISSLYDGLNLTQRKALRLVCRNTPEREQFRKSLYYLDLLSAELKAEPEQIYDFLVEMTQCRNDYPLMYGHGIITEIMAAIPQHTELRPTDNLWNSVDFNSNFNPDKPLLFPIPLILVAGNPTYKRSETKMPHHDIGGVIGAAVELINNPDTDTKRLAELIGAPFLHIGGKLINKDEAPSIYERGEGTFRFIISEELFNPNIIYGCSLGRRCHDYCRIYGYKKYSKVSSKQYEVDVEYKALLTGKNGTRLFSLKEMLNEYIEFYRSEYQNITGEALTDEIFCEILKSQWGGHLSWRK